MNGNRMHLVRFAIALAAVLPASASKANSVELEATHGATIAREAAWVASGIPFAKGQLRDASRLTVAVGGRAIPAQFTPLAPWEDGSVRWALMDTRVALPAEGAVKMALTDSGKNPAPAQPVALKQGANAVTVTTGPLALVLSTKQPGLIQSLSVDGRERITRAGKGPVLTTVDGKEVAAAAPDTVVVERNGPMRAIVCLRGGFPGVHNGLLKYTARFHVFAGQSYVKVEFWLENQGADGRGKTKPEWFAFDSLALDFGVGLGDGVKAHCEGVSAAAPFRVLQICRKGEGRNVPHYTDENFVYTIRSGTETVKEGERTDGLVRLQGSAGALTVGIRHFWQNYEKAIEYDGNALRLWLWPTEGEWPRPAGGFGSRYARRLSKMFAKNRYMLPGSVHKGHEFILDVSDRPVEAVAADLSQPAFARAPAEHYALTDAMPGLFVAGPIATGNRTADFKLRGVERMGTVVADPAHEGSLFSARREHSRFHLGYLTDQSYWHGWMDFGDLSVPGKGHVSLHYDWPMLVMHEYLRNGNPHALELATQMIRHLIDIDQSWSDRDPPHMNALQKSNVLPTWHAGSRADGGVSPGSTHLAGAALWHMLTGDAKAREACLRGAEGLVRAWEHHNKQRVYGGGIKVNMEANAWTLESYCAVYALTGDKRWLDEALKLFNENVVAKWKQHGPHLHSPGTGQIRGQSYIEEDRKYAYAIGPLCNLHRFTRDETVLKLLVEGCETPLSSDSYFDAPIFGAGLYAYVGGVTDNADFLKRAARTVMLSFPESRQPPVFIPDNKDWSERAAMLMRAADVVRYGFSRKEKP